MKDNEITEKSILNQFRSRFAPLPYKTSYEGYVLLRTYENVYEELH